MDGRDEDEDLPADPGDHLWLSASNSSTQTYKERASQLAAAQFGRVARRQLVARGIPSPTVVYWTRTTFLHRVLPGVYAVGYLAPSTQGDLAGALLYAGPYASLSHDTALWWLGLSDRRSGLIHVSTPRRCRSLGSIIVHDRRVLPTAWHNNLRVTTASQTLLDYAANAPVLRVRKALANAEFHRLLDRREIDALTVHGRPGSARLRAAIARHEPKLARTRSDLEDAFLLLCEAHKIPLPEVNFPIEDFVIDALWPDQRLAVELDGGDGHHTPAQMRRDRRRDLRLRQLGFVVLRYTYDQVHFEPELVAADVKRHLQLG